MKKISLIFIFIAIFLVIFLLSFKILTNNKLENESEQKSAPVDVNIETQILSAVIGKSVSLLGVTITPLEVLEDSRCPIDVMCIQAGTVRVKVTLKSGSETSSQIFELGKKLTTEAEEVTLIKVEPVPEAGKGGDSTSYVFYFQIKKR